MAGLEKRMLKQSASVVYSYQYLLHESKLLINYLNQQVYVSVWYQMNESLS